MSHSDELINALVVDTEKRLKHGLDIDMALFEKHIRLIYKCGYSDRGDNILKSIYKSPDK